jgi:putative acetyltransferase
MPGILSKSKMNQQYYDFIIRAWQPSDRLSAAEVIRTVLAEYGLNWEPKGADRDVLEVESHYLVTGGEFWVVKHQGEAVGTSAYYPINRGHNAVEIRKMYLLPMARGHGLGRFLLQTLEARIQARGFSQIWIETASILVEAVQLYERHGYKAVARVETLRCDLAYLKTLSPQ